MAPSEHDLRNPGRYLRMLLGPLWLLLAAGQVVLCWRQATPTRLGLLVLYLVLGVAGLWLSARERRALRETAGRQPQNR